MCAICIVILEIRWQNTQRFWKPHPIDSAGHFDEDTESRSDAQHSIKMARSLVLIGLATALETGVVP